MKYFAFFSIFLITIGTGRHEQTTKVKLRIIDCRTGESYTWFRADTVVFYKLPEGTVAFKIRPKDYRKFPIELNDIPVSAYKLIYKNNARQKCIKEVNLINQKTNTITLCVDSLENYTYHTLQQLTDNDSIVIDFRSQGCFHSYEMKVLVIKQPDKFIARLYKSSFYYEREKKQTIIRQYQDSLIKTTILTEKNIEDFTRFENEVRRGREAGCTTTDWYDIRSKYLNISNADGSCDWRGFHYLRKSFFGLKE